MNPHKLLKCCPLLILCLSFATSVFAANFELLDSQFGTGSIVYDKSTGLDWLQPNLSFGKTYQSTIDDFTGFTFADESKLAALFKNFGLLTPVAPLNSVETNDPSQNVSDPYLSFFSYFNGVANLSRFMGTDTKKIYIVGRTASKDISQSNASHFLSAVAFVEDLNGLAPNYTSSKVSYTLTQLTTNTLDWGAGGSSVEDDASVSDFGGWLYRSHISNALPVPEPDTYVLMLAGLGLFGVVARKSKTVI